MKLLRILAFVARTTLRLGPAVAAAGLTVVAVVGAAIQARSIHATNANRSPWEESAAPISDPLFLVWVVAGLLLLISTALMTREGLDSLRRQS